VIYISLVGTQIMAVLNPLLSLAENGIGPDRLGLLTTGFTYPVATAIKSFLIEKGMFSDENIHIIPISNTLVPNEKGHLPIHEVIREIATHSEDFSFNMAGGMNFQIAAAVNVIETEKCLYLYPEQRGVHAIRIKTGGTVVDHRCYPLPAAEHVLELQGIPYEIERGQDNPFTIEVFKECGIELPPLRRVRIGNTTNLSFDCVWNNGNELKFLKTIYRSPGDGKKAEDYLDEARAVIGLSTGRDALRELYHRTIAVLTNHPLVAERIGAEGRGKIDVLFVRPGNAMAVAMAGFEIKRILNIPAPYTSRAVEIDQYTCSAAETSVPVLLLSLGRDILPTLIALWSHKPERVCFVYTPEDPTVVRYRDALLKDKSVLPAGRVSFYPVSIAGSEIMSVPVPEKGPVIVNISPGTKGHTAFLALWAKMHQAGLYSLVSDVRQACPISMGDCHPLSGPEPAELLRLTGFRVDLSHTTGKERLRKEAETYEGILEFIEMAGSQSADLSNFSYNELRLPNAYFSRIATETGRIDFTTKSKQVQWSLRQGEWFERLMGYVLIKSGADEVQCRIRTQWSEETAKHLTGKYQQGVFMSDIDVVGRFGSDYYVISCKTTKKQQVRKLVGEVQAVASLFGRFAVPLLCFLQFGGEAYTVEGVYVFGHRTFANPDSMKSLLMRAIADRQKTRQ
jgi:hypothetical protein